MDQKCVVVLDMDETLGFYEGTTFHVRPNYKTLIDFLHLIRADIILWSLGTNDYVKRMVNGFLPELAKRAYKIFARSEAEYGRKYYNVSKASIHIRDIYRFESIFLIAIDDHVAENMDDQYDLRIRVRPYTKVNSCDKEMMQVVETLIKGITKLKSKNVQRGSLFETDSQCPDKMGAATVAPAA